MISVIRQNKIWTFKPEYGKMKAAVLGFFLAIEGGVHMGKDLKGRDLGVGIYQRQDGLYSARYTNKLGKRKEKYFKKLGLIILSMI